ncbi:hypothetical protein SGPA1_30732 [Streptomyces misionensis JCM 4497]
MGQQLRVRRHYLPAVRPQERRQRRTPRATPQGQGAGVLRGVPRHQAHPRTGRPRRRGHSPTRTPARHSRRRSRRSSRQPRTGRVHHRAPPARQRRVDVRRCRDPRLRSTRNVRRRAVRWPPVSPPGAVEAPAPACEDHRPPVHLHPLLGRCRHGESRRWLHGQARPRGAPRAPNPGAHRDGPLVRQGIPAACDQGRGIRRREHPPRRPDGHRVRHDRRLSPHIPAPPQWHHGSLTPGGNI